MDRLNYKEVNIEMTKKLIQERKDKENLGTIKRHKKIVEIITKYIKTSDSIFEIGCREGDLFVQLEDMGFNNLYGIDISTIGIDILNKRGYKGHVADAKDDFKIGNRKFNVVIMSHCLEHIPEPANVINNIYKCLNDNGILYVEVPKQKKEPVPTVWGHYYLFSSMEELIGFFDLSKWKILYKKDENKNLRAVLKKVT